MNADELIMEIFNKSIGGTSLYGNSRYDKLSNEYNEILQELLSYIPEDKKDIWGRLENIILQMVVISDKDIYKRGFKDGATLIMGIK